MESSRAPNIFAILLPQPNGRSEFAEIAQTRPVSLIEINDDDASGFAQAKNLGCTHVVAFDNDAQTYASDLPALLDASDEHPTALVIGCRIESPPTRRLWQLLFRLETGLRLKCLDGPRVYPLALIDVIDPSGKRHFGDTEILVRAAWAGCPIIEMPLPAGAPGDCSHSLSTRPMLRELAMHFRLIGRALSGWPHPKYESGIIRPARQAFWSRVWRWLNPFAAWRELRQGGISRNEMAVGLAVGVFIGNMPVWGFHTVLSLYVAKRLHLNPLAVMTGSHVSAPPMGILIVASAMWTGHVILHGVPPKWENITPFHGKFMEHLVSNVCDWTLGAVLVGTALATITYVVANFLFRFVERPSAEALIAAGGSLGSSVTAPLATPEK